eukprot:gb/GECH01000540.1/.p1 GENE.gb/GECH01000540.1/~~gb/GECH01000540.1/.p1  ORF type:complete len:172 (+),score=26.60 gb/GECH01000540.1/:1-516(+)
MEPNTYYTTNNQHIIRTYSAQETLFGFSKDEEEKKWPLEKVEQTSSRFHAQVTADIDRIVSEYKNLEEHRRKIQEKFKELEKNNCQRQEEAKIWEEEARRCQEEAKNWEAEARKHQSEAADANLQVHTLQTENNDLAARIEDNMSKIRELRDKLQKPCVCFCKVCEHCEYK